MLRDFLARTLRGLNPSYFYRQLFFGALIGALWLWMVFKANADAPNAALFTVTVILGVVNTLLYPFARFAYETIMDFIIGSNMFIVNAMLLLMVKLFTMVMCWAFAFFVAPVGLLILFFMNRPRMSNMAEE